MLCSTNSWLVQVEGSLRSSNPAANEAMVVAYPDICFAVDDSDGGFGSLVCAFYLQSAISQKRTMTTVHFSRTGISAA